MEKGRRDKDKEGKESRKRVETAEDMGKKKRRE